MAITNSLAHTYPGSHVRPGELLDHVNRHLQALYTPRGDTSAVAHAQSVDPDRGPDRRYR